jgi:hypothetical protein
MEVFMADWIIDRAGEPVQILDEYCFRSLGGEVVAWLFGNGVYTVKGDHIGWFEMSTLYDLQNGIVGMLQHACAPLSPASVPDEMPPFARRPHVPPLKVRRMRPASADTLMLKPPPVRFVHSAFQHSY